VQKESARHQQLYGPQVDHFREAGLKARKAITESML